MQDASSSINAEALLSFPIAVGAVCTGSGDTASWAQLGHSTRFPLGVFWGFLAWFLPHVKKANNFLLQDTGHSASSVSPHVLVGL